MKGILKFVFILAVIIALLVAGRNVIAKVAIEQGMKAATGVPLSIKNLDIGLAKTHIGINELNLFNPEGFADKTMLHAPEIFVDYNLAALMKGQVHLEDVRLNFDQLVIVKNQQGQMNLDALKPKAGADQTTSKKEDQAGTKEQKAPSVRIDRLSLKVGKVIYKDYSQGGAPAIKEYNINLSEEIRDVTDPKSLLSLIVSKALMQTALGSLADFNIDVEKASSQAVDALKGELGTFTDKIKLPFGN
ncbi:MAG TPA: AsmA family protein [Candidatus Omnitrophota bacterium]|nr:AsmA family protein [Candidatus Omnitrophota bacterium]